MGRELFGLFRGRANEAEKGASAMFGRDGMVSMEVVAVDIGGTHVRFAIAEVTRWPRSSRSASLRR